MKFVFCDLIKTKNIKKNKAIKELLLKEKLYLKKGALISILDSKKGFSLSSIDCIVLIYKNNKPIGWAAVLGGFSPQKHKDILPSYAHLAVFIKPKHRKQGLAKKSLNILINNFKKKNLIKEYSFNYLAFSSPSKLFKPLVIKFGYSPQYFRGLYSSKIMWAKP